MADGGLRALAESFGVPFLETLGPELFDPAFVTALPVDWARRHAVLPVRLPGGSAALAMPDSASMPLLQHASLATGEDMAPVFAPRAEILRAVDAAWFAGRGTGSAATAAPEARPAAPAAGETARPAAPGPAAGSEGDLLVARGEPVERFWSDTLLDAVREGASDVHADPLPDGGVRIRFRLSGRLYDRPGPPQGLGRQVVSRVKVLAKMDIAEHRLPQDGMMQLRAGGRAVDVRVSTVPVADGERVVLRLLDREDSLRPLSALGMPEPVHDAFSALLASPNGIVVVSGPTGSGKTTTLYSALGGMDATRRNVMTVEDPVEYRLPGIAQIQVKPKIGLTFASGLRHILRQDPDVVLVGETRDAETAEIAVRASLTGHLVFTTLHTNDAASAPMRLVDMGVEPYLLASCLRGVLAQRLVRRACPSCSRVLPFGSADLSGVEERLARAAGCTGVLRAPGCASCLEGGVGRTGVFELLRCDAAVADAIHAGRLDAASLAAAAGPALLPMSADASAKLRASVATPAEILAALGPSALSA